VDIARICGPCPWATLCVIFVACGDPVPSDVPDPDDPPGCDQCEIRDEHNFRLDVVLYADSTQLCELRNATLDWCGLTTDLLARPLESCEEVRSATLYTLHDTTQAEILLGLARDDLEQSVINQFWACEPTDCGCGLADFSFIGHPLIPDTDFAREDDIWLLSLDGGDSRGVLALSFLEPDAGTQCSELAVDDATSGVAVHVDLEASRALVVTAVRTSRWTGRPSTPTVSASPSCPTASTICSWIAWASPWRTWTTESSNSTLCRSNAGSGLWRVTRACRSKGWLDRDPSGGSTPMVRGC